MAGKFPRRGDVYWVALDPTIGSETKKTRPCLVVSNDLGNELSDLVILAPITSKISRIYPYNVKVNVKGKDGKVMLNQVRAIDKARIGELICSFDTETMDLVDEALRIVFGL
jgi:mRNA interferase MazF